jgi:acylpyruvate hydrolase
VRLLTYDDGSGPQAGVLLADEQQIVPVAALSAPVNSVRGLLHALDQAGLAELGRRAGEADRGVALSAVRLLAPVPDPEKIICLGLNYRDHAAEAGAEIPSAPMWFAKFANSLIGSGGPILLPPAYPAHVDYEAELAVVIGRVAARVSAAEALSYVAGAMPFNDAVAHAAHARQRRAAAGGQHRRSDLRRRRDRRVALAHHDAAPGRRDRDRHAGRRGSFAGPLPPRG